MRKVLLFLLFILMSVGSVFADPLKCTSTSDLTAGEVYYISSASSYSSSGIVMAKSTTDGANNFPQTTFAGSPVELTLGGSSGQWVFTYKDGNTTYYLNATSTTGSNVLRRKTTNDNYGKFSISFSNGAAVITCTGKNSRNIVRYNSSSSCFSCYTSGQNAVYLYKKVSAYTITAVSNNNSYGTVSLSGSIITATPQSGYKISTSEPYTVTVGTATVVNNGNGTFTVTPTSNCTVRINFEEIQQHTVNWYNGSTLLHSQTANDGTSYTDPGTLTSSDCDGHKSFAGWTKNSTYSSDDTAPSDLFSYTSDSIINRNVNYYAVFANVEGGSGFKLSLNNGGTEYYVGRKGSGSFLLAPTDEASAAVFTFDNGQLYYDDSGTRKYISSEGNNTTLNIQTTPTTATWTESGTTTFTYQSSATGNRYLGFNNSADPKRFAPYGSTYPHVFTKHSVVTYTNYSTVCEIIDVTGVTLNESAISIYVNNEYQLAATISPANASDKIVNWTSANTDIVTVDENGLVTGVAEGVAVVTCTTHDGSFTATCTVTVLGKPNIDIVEWNPDWLKIDVENFTAATATLEDQNTQADIEINYADSLFFSKYFEAKGNVKLLGIYNGTNHDIDLSGYKIKFGEKGKTTMSGQYDWSEPGSECRFIADSLMDTVLLSGHELIFAAYVDGGSDTSMIKCAKNNPKSGWNSYVFASNMNFNGNDAVALVNPQGNLIDIIGAGNISKENLDSVKPGSTAAFMDDPGWYSPDGINYNTNDSNYALSTTRCLLIRKKNVKSGLNAVARNTLTFATLGGIYGEWRGLQIPKSDADEGVQATCDGFDDIGSFDYNDYYIDYDTIKTIADFKADTTDGYYKISIPQLDTLSCTNLKITVKDESSNELEKIVKIPIMIKTNTTTDDDDYFDKKDCDKCDVVVLKDKTLTVAGTASANRDMKLYEGAELRVPTSTSYTLNSLALRRENDTVSSLYLNGGTLTVTDKVYFDLYITSDDWHYVALPGNFSLSNVKFTNGKTPEHRKDFWARHYDGYLRSRNLTGGWQAANVDSVFSAGQGFIFGLDDRYKKKEFRFEFNNSILTSETSNKTIPNLVSWGCGDDNLRPNHKGWNLIGNPYLGFFNAEIYDKIRVDSLVKVMENGHWTGLWELSNDSRAKTLRYAVIPSDAPEDRDAGGYKSVLLDDMKLSPFICFFVQIGGNDESAKGITMSAARKTNKIVARNYQEDEDDELFLRVKVDNWKTGMFISKYFSDKYEPGDDLESRYPIYQSIGGYKLLYSAINDSIIEHGVQVTASQGTLYLDPKVDISRFEYIYANYNNEWYDLKNGETVEVSGSFLLQAKRKVNDTPTDIDMIIKGNTCEKFIYKNDLYIKKNNHLYNVLGGQIK